MNITDVLGNTDNLLKYKKKIKFCKPIIFQTNGNLTFISYWHLCTSITRLICEKNILSHHFVWRFWSNLTDHFNVQGIYNKEDGDSTIVPKSVFQEKISYSETTQREEKRHFIFSKMCLIWSKRQTDKERRQKAIKVNSDTAFIRQVERICV